MYIYTYIPPETIWSDVVVFQGHHPTEVLAGLESWDLKSPPTIQPVLDLRSS